MKFFTLLILAALLMTCKTPVTVRVFGCEEDHRPYQTDQKQEKEQDRHRNPCYQTGVTF